jgi:CYTH domain-containing protein
MAKEIEKKYLVKNSDYKENSSVTYIQQGYISTQKERVVRVRIKDDKGYITIKGENNGAIRLEYEYTIPLSEAKEMIETLCQKPIIEKYRYSYKAADGHTWEIDEFLGDNEGLVVAEIELLDENEVFTLPEWIGEDVTSDIRYYNSNLMINPYKNWKNK